MAFIQLNYPSGALQQNTDVSIILPDPPGSAHVSPGQAYQTLYLLHGTYGDHSDWWRKTALERYAQEACLAVVMPSCGNAFYQDMVHGPKYKTFLLEELPAYLRSILPLSPRREDTFIAGLSMGGYGAMHLALSKPGQYAAAASLSGVMSFSRLARQPQADQPWPIQAIVGFISPAAIDRSQRNVVVQARSLKNRGIPLPALFLSVGTEDFTLKDNRDGVGRLRRLGVKVTYEEHPGAHTWAYWDTHIQRVLAWLPLRGDLVEI